MNRFPIESIEIAYDLIQRYAVSGPRYTSYPTAVEFHPGMTSQVWREELERDLQSSEEGAASLYFHLPFCRELCYFCACNKVITKDRSVIPPYLKALAKEIDTYRTLLNGRSAPLEWIHWGGGSPNYLTPDEMRWLHETALNSFSTLLPDADVSVELDPRTTTQEQIKTLAEIGFNRMSFGVQDFDQEVQEIINRVQSFEQTKALVDSARDAGLTGINVDLIYGLSLQTEERFARTVERVLELRPDRVALYGYAHVTWLQKVQRTLEREHLPLPDERVRIFLRAVKMFSEAGYEYIGLDHFALPEDSLSKALESGKLMRNFMGYTTHRGSTIYAFGASSISSTRGAFAQNVKAVGEYQSLIERDGLAIERGVKRNQDDLIRGEVIEDLLCRGVVDIRSIEQRFQIAFADYFSDSLPLLNPFIDDGVVTVSGQRIEVTPLGRLFARNVAMTFDAYLKKHQAGEKRVFSQAV